MPYTNALYCAAIPSLLDHREHLACKFFKSILQLSSCLFNLLPTSTGSLDYNSSKIWKQVPAHPYPHQKIPNIYFSCFLSLPIETFLNTLFVCLSYIYNMCCRDNFSTGLLGPFHGGHSGPLCHALSLSSMASWTSMHRRRATVLLATPGEWA